MRQTLSRKEFLQAITTMAAEFRLVIEAECSGFSADPAASEKRKRRAVAFQQRDHRRLTWRPRPRLPRLKRPSRRPQLYPKMRPRTPMDRTLRPRDPSRGRGLPSVMSLSGVADPP